MHTKAGDPGIDGLWDVPMLHDGFGDIESGDHGGVRCSHNSPRGVPIPAGIGSTAGILSYMTI